MPDDQDWIDELYAEGAKEVPPPELDAKIRAAARQPVRHPWYRSPGRLTVLATAASLVIAVSVIFFQPEQPKQPMAPAETAPVAAEQAAPGSKRTVEPAEPASGRREADNAAAIRPEPANRPATSTLNGEPARLRSSGSRQPATAAAEAAAATDARVMEAERAAAGRAELLLEEAAVADSAIGSLVVAEEAAAELIARCGPLPGSEETRAISSDASGWLVTVTVGSDVRTWRCIDGAWLETSEQQ